MIVYIKNKRQEVDLFETGKRKRKKNGRWWIDGALKQEKEEEKSPDGALILLERKLE